MSADFKPVPLTKLPLDAHKHVRFVDGMVLGVDDFEQEFAYLSERDKLLVRMLAGYGVVRGLRVFAQGAGAAGPEIVVSAGLAITPSGDVVRVPVDQCAAIKDWIVGAGVAPTTVVGDTGTLEAYVTAEYATRTSDPVPIPGEPCRTESEVTADSRTADSFRLELSLTVPEHPDDGLVSAYLKWIDTIPRTETGGTSVEEIARGVVRAAWEKSVAGDPPLPVAPTETPVFASHPRGPGGTEMTLNRKDFLNAYLTDMERLPDIRALSAVLESSVTGALQTGTDAKPQMRLLLAKITVPVVRSAPGSNVFFPKTADGSDIVIETKLAPRLLSLQYLLRAALAGLRKVGESAVTQPRSDARYVIAAAGQVKAAANEGDAIAAAAAGHSIGGLRAWVDGADKVIVAFDGLDLPSDRYVVKVLSSVHSGVTTSACLIAFDATKRSQFTLAITADPAPGSLVDLGLSIEVGAILD